MTLDMHRTFGNSKQKNLEPHLTLNIHAICYWMTGTETLVQLKIKFYSAKMILKGGGTTLVWHVGKSCVATLRLLWLRDFNHTRGPYGFQNYTYNLLWSVLEWVFFKVLIIVFVNLGSRKCVIVAATWGRDV